MPRPKLYKTASEKRDANRAKSNRSYQKNKDAIALKRRKARSDQQAGASSQETTQPLNAKGHQPRSQESRVEYFLRRARRNDRKLNKLTEGKPAAYIEKVYSAYEARFSSGKTGRKVIENEIRKMAKLRRSIKRWGEKVLQATGTGNEWNDVEDIQKRVQVIIAHLEEMLCEEMVDPKGLIEAHHSHSLAYQKQ